MPNTFMPAAFTGTNWTNYFCDIYRSDSGDDITGDGSPGNPYASFQRCADVQNGDINKWICSASCIRGEAVASVSNMVIFADGKNVITGLGLPSGAIAFQSISNFGRVFLNPSIGKLTGDFEILDFTYALSSPRAGTAPPGEVNNVYFKNILNFNVAANSCVNILNSTLYNVATLSQYPGAFGDVYPCKMSKVTVVASNNVDIRGIERVENCLFDNVANEIRTSTYNLVVEANNYTNVNSFKHYNNDNTVTVSYPTLTDYKNDAFTGALNDVSYEIAVDFMQVDMEQYAISRNSPLKNLGTDGLQIGNYYASQSYDGLLDEQGVVSPFSVAGGATLTNWAIDGNGNSSIAVAGSDATRESAPIILPVAQYLNRISFIGQNDLLGGVALSVQNNTPNIIPTVQIRWTDNPGTTPLNTTTYQTFKLGIIPEIDGSGNGNGDPNFNPQTATRFLVKEMQFFERITENYIQQ